MSTDYYTADELYLKEHEYPKRRKGEPKDTYRGRMTEAQLAKYLAALDTRKAKRKATRERKMQFKGDYDYDGELEDIDPAQFTRQNNLYNTNFKIQSDNDYRSNNWYKAVTNRDLKYNPNLLLRKNAQKLAKSVKGRAYYGDINGDRIPDVTVFDKFGKMVAFNGYRPKRSRHLLNMDYVYNNPDGNEKGRLTKKDVNALAAKYAADHYDDVEFKKINKKLAKAGFAGYRIKKVRVTLNQLLNDRLKQMYDMKFTGEDTRLVPFTLYKSIIIRAFLNCVFGLEHDTLATDPAGKIVTKIINKKDKESDAVKRYDNYRTTIANMFASITDAKIIDIINKNIKAVAFKYQLGDSSIKQGLMKDVGSKLEIALNKHYKESYEAIFKLSHELFKLEVTKKTDTRLPNVRFREGKGVSYDEIEDIDDNSEERLEDIDMVIHDE